MKAISKTMRYFSFKKLVRDRIVELMKECGEKPVGVKVLSEKRFVKELVLKLVEESTEMLKIKDMDKLKEELVDVIEVTDYLRSHLKLSDKEFKKLLKEKRKGVGGFDKRIYLDCVGVTKDNKWTKYYLNNPDRYPEIKEK